MAVRTFAITGALVVGAALAYESVAGEPHADPELLVVLPFQTVQEQDSTYLERLRSALEHVTSPLDSTRIESFLRARNSWQDSSRTHLSSGVTQCPMPVFTDSTAMPMPTVRSGGRSSMPVIRSGCVNPLFAEVKPDSQ